MSAPPASPSHPASDAKLPGKKSPSHSRRIFGWRIKFIWGASRVIRGRWYLGLLGRYDRVEGMPADGLAVSVRGLLLWGLGSAIALYVGGATAIYTVRSRNPYNLASYSDVLLWPLHRAHMAELTGRALLAEGMADTKTGRHGEGASKLRVGLILCPEDTAARLALAQLYARSNQRSLAQKTLTDRLNGNYPGREYLEALFSFAADGEDYAVILDVCNHYRVGRDTPAADRPWLLQRQVQTLLAARRAGEALQLAEVEGADAPVTVKEMRVMALIELGHYDAAVEFLAHWRARAGNDLALVMRLQVRAFREAHRWNEMADALQILRSLAPTDPNPAVDGIVQCAIAGLDEPAAAALDDYFFRFGGSRDNLLLATQPLAEIGALPLVQRCLDRATSLGYDLQPFRRQLFVAQMQRGDWMAARRTLEQLPPRNRLNDPGEKIWLRWQECLVAALNDPAPVVQEALLDIFQTQPLPLPIFNQTGTLLLRAHRAETARRILDVGQRYYPASSSLAKLLAEAERALGAGLRPGS